MRKFHVGEEVITYDGLRGTIADVDQGTLTEWPYWVSTPGAPFPYKWYATEELRSADVAAAFPELNERNN